METGTIRLRVAEMASFFGIQTWFEKNVEELSGGQKQLLNLAAVMAMQPDLLVLDERHHSSIPWRRGISWQPYERSMQNWERRSF